MRRKIWIDGLGTNAVEDFTREQLLHALRREQALHKATEKRLKTALHLLRNLAGHQEYDNSMTRDLYKDDNDVA